MRSDRLANFLDGRVIFGNHLEGIVKVPVDDVDILLDIDRRSLNLI
ncbi:MAG: hypothetical protein ABSH02_12345 [Candidatus Sulfotelmatobacter sp.]